MRAGTMSDIAIYVGTGLVAVLGLKAVAFAVLSRRMGGKDRERRD